MSVTSRYKDAWEGFWRDTSYEPGEVFWDAEASLTAAVHLDLFDPHVVHAGLPFVDVGCGNGTQTRFLAGRYVHVVGADFSAAALDHARRADPTGSAEFRLLDATEQKEAEELHAELGDVNVYMRGVLHQCEPADRQPLLDSVAALVGARGRAFMVDPSEEAGPFLMSLSQGPAGPPAKLAPVLAHGIAPAEVSDAAVPGYVRAAGLDVLASGELPLTTTEYTSDGVRIDLPSRWLVLGRTG
ncbi:methyltransferase domain-containing protein [Streptomyces sp. NPDC046821]|uniref:class I SAM-dependent methyltransferase n=1 Tax=Streptomyces sp. NPDC046821 TaxID=3154702 RepID=UPI0033E13AD2